MKKLSPLTFLRKVHHDDAAFSFPKPFSPLPSPHTNARSTPPANRHVLTGVAFRSIGHGKTNVIYGFPDVISCRTIFQKRKKNLDTNLERKLVPA
ncbi:hypothetical protein GWI33_011965 [Rhynchophorus ferrugineus]|uniref:Uncharacterized protein n=1 Tax=Rhynchophorus ferrugineus TaxID=354439 RepID=A0A834IPU1_RHYFE|nr:hypothetical protein GWI33_011965 [Rhynchophorus ferrugineus]